MTTGRGSIRQAGRRRRRASRRAGPAARQHRAGIDAVLDRRRVGSGASSRARRRRAGRRRAAASGRRWRRRAGRIGMSATLARNCLVGDRRQRQEPLVQLGERARAGSDRSIRRRGRGCRARRRRPALRYAASWSARLCTSYLTANIANPGGRHHDRARTTSTSRIMRPAFSPAILRRPGARRCARRRAAAPSGRAGCGRSRRRRAGAGRRCSSRKLGAGASGGGGTWREARGAASLRRRRKFLTRRVFERVERHDGEPAARHQQPLGGGEPAIELAELVVDRDAQRLKRAGRRIEPGLALRHRRAHDLGQLAGAADRPALRARRRWRGRPAAAKRSSPSARISSASSSSEQARDEIGGALARRRSCACRAARRGETKSRARRSSSCIDDTPRSSAMPATGRGAQSAEQPLHVAEAALDQRSSRPPCLRGERGRAATASGSRSIATTRQRAAASSAAL